MTVGVSFEKRREGGVVPSTSYIVGFLSIVSFINKGFFRREIIVLFTRDYM